MRRQNLDLILLIAVLFLLLLGVCFVFTASSARAERLHQDSAFYLKRQMLRLLIGLLLGFLMMRVDYHKILQISPLIYMVSLALLVFLLFAPESWMIRGSRRWLMLGPVQFQPSELAKYGLVFYLAMNLAKPKLDLRKFGDGLAPQLLLISAIVIVVALEPDLGSALMIAAVALCLLFLAGAKLAHLFALLSTAALVIVAFTARVAYQRGRVESFVESFVGNAEPAWQVKQSLIGLGTGGLTGLGLGNSKQKLMFLPDPFTDFIMSIIGEELGLLGALLVIGLFLLILWRGFHIARHAPDHRR
ncbi:stage V sporulation protein E, partial [candidate division KSB1 bacterium]|nr:stage V sporulation protein E [candidate division KSB1 bacterium]